MLNATLLLFFESNLERKENSKKFKSLLQIQQFYNNVKETFIAAERFCVTPKMVRTLYVVGLSLTFHVEYF